MKKYFIHTIVFAIIACSTLTSCSIKGPYSVWATGDKPLPADMGKSTLKTGYGSDTYLFGIIPISTTGNVEDAAANAGIDSVYSVESELITTVFLLIPITNERRVTVRGK